MVNLLRIVAAITAPVWLLSGLTFAQDEAATPSASPVASPVIGDIGRAVRWQDWMVTVEDVEFVTVVGDNSYAESHARGKYLVVRLTVVNESRAPLEFPDYDVRAIDDQERVFTRDLDASLDLMIAEDMEFIELQPGVTYDYAIVYDVAPDAEGFVLALLGTGDLTLDLGV